MARNHTVLVSAGAGSGKTAVLVERITQLLREGASIDRMLVVTFTRAAAAEMRQRLSNELRKYARTEATNDAFGAYAYMDEPANAHACTKALLLMESAQISTLHSFCQTLIRNNFNACGIDPNSTPCSDSLREGLFDEACRCAFNEILGEDYPKSCHDWFGNMCSAFGIDTLAKMVEELYNFAMSLPDPQPYLMEKAQDIADEYTSALWYKYLTDDALRMFRKAQRLQENTLTMLDLPQSLTPLLETAKADKAALDNIYHWYIYEEKACNFADRCKNIQWARQARVKATTDQEKEWLEKFQNIRKKYKDIVKKIPEMLKIDPEKMAADADNVRLSAQTLIEATFLTKKYFDAAKRARSVIDYTDMEQLAAELLHNPEIVEQTQAKYDHIFVDECQDLSSVQDFIIQQLHGENTCLFMVGDVKQSIYRFRQADPTIFLKRMRTYSDQPDARERRILLNKNFRSLVCVIEGVNHVFRQIMKSDVTELDYLPEDELVCGRVDATGPKLEVRLCLSRERNETNMDMSAVAEQADVIATKIRDILAMDVETGDPASPTKRYRFRDMVILLSALSTVGRELADELTRRGIPVFYDGKTNYYGLPEVQKVVSILQVVYNPCNDVALLTVMRNQPFCFTSNELMKIREYCGYNRHQQPMAFWRCVRNIVQWDRETDEIIRRFNATHENKIDINQHKTPLTQKVRQMWEKIEDWQEKQTCMPLKQFIWVILNESRIYMMCGALHDGELRQGNLRVLTKRIEDYESSTPMATLGGFLENVSREKMSGGDSNSAKPISENDDVVRIMTMHKSKGLEFPVVFLPMLQQKLYTASRSKLKTNRLMGVCLPVIHPESNVVRQCPISSGFESANKLDQMAEKCRLLYVAMTRARDMLVMIGSAKDENRLWFQPESSDRVYGADSMLDWVMQSMKGYDGKQYWTDDLFDVIHTVSHPAEERQNQWDYTRAMEMLDEMARINTEMGGKYPEKDKKPRYAEPVVMSVTGLVKKGKAGLPAEEMAEETAEDKRKPIYKSETEVTEANSSAQASMAKWVGSRGDRKWHCHAPLQKGESEQDNPAKGESRRVQGRSESPCNSKQIPNTIQEEERRSWGATDTPLNRTNFAGVYATYLPEGEEEDQRSIAKEKQKEGAPSFTPLERGTAVHKVLCRIPLEPLRGVPDESMTAVVSQVLESLVSTDMLTSDEAAAADPGKIARFFTSKVGRELLASPTVRREWRFVTTIAGSKTLLQGVIDCAFVLPDGTWAVLDYKTDRNTSPSHLMDLYALQLHYYAGALENSGKSVSRQYLFPIESGREIRVK